AKSVSVPIQCGGGIRDEKIIKRLLKSGVKRVVLGTKAIENLEFLRKIIKRFKNKIAVSIDEQKGIIAIRGWRKKTNINKKIFLKKLKEAGLKVLIYTDISLDGMLQGPNISGIKKTLNLAKIPMIASGGISSLEDIKKLKKIEKKGVVGVIIGKALYENKFSLKEALEIA
ncbi:MAG: HisA/HisF-related TIM barrel protein, partial [Candidatus Omnitrophota bacterium]